MKFKDFYSSQKKNRIKDHPEYNIIIKNILKLMYAIAQSMNKPIWATYLYLSLIESLAIMMNTIQQ